MTGPAAAPERQGPPSVTDSAAPAADALVPGTVDSGILLLDKPTGMSSNRALQQVKRALSASKAGHAGTLDPLATGMLPLLLGEATKVAGLLLGRDKAYRVSCRLGQVTDTYDADGQVVAERPVPALDHVRIEQALARFRGRIRQRPPAYSAIKMGGQPLYKRARRGEEVSVPEREVHIVRLQLLQHAAEHLQLQVECGSGTYIRSLVHDLGQVLGCGAHVTALRRLWVAPFRGQAMATLDAVLAGGSCPLLDPAAALSGMPRLSLDAGQLAILHQGRQLPSPHVLPTGTQVAALDGDGRLAGLLQVAAGGNLRPRRMLVAAAG